MGYSLNAVQAEAVLQALKQNYSVYAPKRFPKQGRYSDTDVIKYAEVEHYEDIVWQVKSDYPRVECIHSSGKKRVLCLLFEGIPVGEDECLFGGPREYRAVAVTACQIFRIPAEVFKRRAEASPALALKLFQISARKSQVLGRMLIRDSFLSVRGRVIQFLLSVSEPYGTEEGAGVRLTIRLTHQEVADFLGISRVVVSQCFQSLSREGLLKKTRQHYLLPDRAALEAQLHT